MDADNVETRPTTTNRLDVVVPSSGGGGDNDGGVIGGCNDIESSSGTNQEQLVPSATSNTDAAASKRASKKKKVSSSADGQKKLKKKKKRVVSTERVVEHNAMIKYGSLFLLVAQMVGLVLLMRYSRTTTSKGEGEGKDLYLASTAVFIMETMKFLICCSVIFIQSGSTLSGLLSELRYHIWESPNEVLKLCVPSLLYTIQNNLLYLALTNLDAATYQVCYQLKILTTALFSATLLQRHFSRLKWTSLVILTVGVAIVQVSGSSDKHASTTPDEAADTTSHNNNRFVGLIAVLCAACTSGFSGVYFEKILKGSKTSLWLRNVQMGLPSILIAYITIYVKDSVQVATNGFFGGYSPLVWIVITIQAAGGLIVAVVVKYADNVLKVFATSFSIIISCIISAFMFDFRPNLMFIVGTALVVASTVMYSRPEPKVLRRKKPILPMTRTVSGGGGGVGGKTRKSSLVM